MTDVENGTELKAKYDPVSTSPEGETTSKTMKLFCCTVSKDMAKGICIGVIIGIVIVIVAVACGVYFSSAKPVSGLSALTTTSGAATGPMATTTGSMATTADPMTTTSPMPTTPYPGPMATSAGPMTTTSPMSTTPYPGVILYGTFETDKNYTAGLDVPSSAAYQALAQSFIQAIEGAYSGSPYESFLDGVFVDQFTNLRGRVEISFTLRLTQLDNDNASPDAQDYLDTDVSNGRLGTSSFRIINHNIILRTPNA
ncbi:uncharacterized protein [Diadema setosum]|uniref:uncharacterized protein n=1 Tax=Diadema setosum TaxID=31175 RepID=UPI003B3A2310